MSRLFSISIIFLWIFNIFLPATVYAKNLFEDASDFEMHQYTWSKEQVEEKIQTMLQKDPQIENWYQLDTKGLYIFANPEDKLNNLPEFTLYFGDKKPLLTALPAFDNPHLPLKGLRVAIDPGHMGGQYAKIEEKYIDLDLPHKNNENLSFDEGTLTVTTAKLLAQKLEAMGAKVFLTKSSPGEAAYPLSFQQWVEKDFAQAVENMVALRTDPLIQQQEREWWQERATATEIFKSTYNFLDLNRRAELINAFNPHLTVSCHYNLGGIYDRDGKTPGTQTDYTLFFVPGAFKRGSMKDEAYRNSSLKNARSRYEFVRLLVTDDIEKSIDLAQIARKHTQNTLRLPMGDDCSYLNVLCLKAQSGIYHRNLTLLRLVHGPVLYAEPLCQDNFENAQKFAHNPLEIIDPIVRVYLRSITDWAHKHQKNVSRKN